MKTVLLIAFCALLGAAYTDNDDYLYHGELVTAGKPSPLFYELWLRPTTKQHFARLDGNFDGHAQITFQVSASTNAIFFDSVFLEYSELSVQEFDSGEQLSVNYRLSSTDSKLLIYSKQPFENDMIYVVEFVYHTVGEISKWVIDGDSTDMKYGPMTGNNRWTIAVPNSGRSQISMILPCVTDSRHRTNVSVVIDCPPDVVCLSSTKAKTLETLKGGWQRIEFETSPRMLITDLTIAIGPFSGLPIVAKGVQISVWSYKEERELLAYCLQEAAEMMKAMENYFAASFPREKIDIILLGREVQIGMKGFGIIIAHVETMRFSRLVSTSSEGIGVTQSIYKLLLRQWLEATIFPPSSGELFLNDGLIGYLAFDLQRLLHPELASFLNSILVVEVIAPAILCDVAGKCADENLSEDDTTLDGYGNNRKKAISLIHMIANIFSPPVFRKVISIFLSEIVNKTWTHEAFLEMLTEQAETYDVRDWCGQPLDFELFLHPWIHQLGLPFLKVIHSDVTGPMQFTQRRFYNGSYYSPAHHIPLFTNGYRNTESTNHYVLWISQEISPCSSTIREKSSRLLLNRDGSGLVIVNYDTETFNEVMANILSNPSQFSASGLRKLTFDHSLTSSATVGSNRFLEELVVSLKLHSTILPDVADAVCIEDARNFFRMLVSIDVPYETLQIVINKLIGKRYASMDWKADGNMNYNILRGSLFEFAVEYDILSSVQRSKDIVNAAIQNCNGSNILSCTLDGNPALHPDIRGAALYGAVKSNDEIAYAHIREIWNKDINERKLSPKQRFDVIRALTASPDAKKAIAFLWNLTSDRSLSAQDYSNSIQSSDQSIVDHLIDMFMKEGYYVTYARHSRTALSHILAYPSQARLQKLKGHLKNVESRCTKGSLGRGRCSWLRTAVRVFTKKMAIMESTKKGMEEYIRHFI